MSDPLIERFCRVADTEIGKRQRNAERDSMYEDAYGAMYFSLYQGEELSTTYVPVRYE